MAAKGTRNPGNLRFLNAEICGLGKITYCNSQARYNGNPGKKTSVVSNDTY